MLDMLGSAIGSAARSFIGGGSRNVTVVPEAPRVSLDRMPVANVKADLTRDTKPADVVGSSDPMSYWTSLFQDAYNTSQKAPK